MSATAVEFDQVSKRYVIRHQRSAYLKDRLTNAMRRLNPFAPARANETVEDFWALRDVSFSIKQGESVGIIGPNGSGKSTSLKILAGVTKQTSGRVAVNGKLGALIEVGAGFHPELSGRENVFLNGSILGMKKAHIAAKFDSIVDFAEVEQFIDTPVKHYSSGMYVRLGFAIAVHNDPEILLIDEVLAVGDLAFQRKCFDKMKELKAGGRTIVLISHSMPHIESMCQRAIMLRKGQLIADGKPREVAEKYVELSDAHGGKAESGRNDTGVTITGVRMIGENGAPTTRAELGKPMTFEIGYDAHRPVKDVFFAFHIDRGQVRIYDSDTRSLGLELFTLNGTGTVRCEVPDLSLFPNSYAVQAVIYTADARPLAHVSQSHLFSIEPPSSLLDLGCGVADEHQRSVVFGPAKWRRVPAQSTVEPIRRIK